MRLFERSPVGLLLLFLIALLAACAGTEKKPPPSDVDPKLTQSGYIEEGDLLALIVGTRPARYREDRDYIPLEIAVVNKGLESLTLTPESFTLVDQDGRRYAAVGRDELVRGYGSVDLDRRLGEIGPVVLGKYQTYQQFPSTLTPSFDKPVARRVSLPRYAFVLDFLYFPRPAEGAVGRKFELFLEAPELPDPVFVRFTI